ncbi:MAG TPA: M23 family metallopeptidase [Candidatus Coprenecus stercoravium]|uniref:M23 family metallopeptidase n=1 Tax=Candidatus Coprenecus stercoravium TaxID=2840735 RepID=A0A9D2K9R9_9BACT|nr:M23 family metallopeptidase [Candidatus Coprenecus stercoravium]
MGKLKYDKELLDFVEDKHPVTYHLLRILKFLGYTLALVLLYYVVFTLFFTTDEERSMISEKRLIEMEYSDLSSQTDLLEGVVAELEQKDEDIYRELFNTSFPDYSFTGTWLSDTSSTADIIFRTSQRASWLYSDLDRCSELLESVTDSLLVMDGGELSRIPAIIPIADFPLGNVGASVGRKMHPFYKKMVYHGGLDLVVPSGVDVRATADGRVSSVERAMKLQGTRIIIDHGNGYETVYAHLSDVLVRNGQRVRRGDIIARTGNSGTSFAPHLHYEVIKDGQQLDPLCFFNAELDNVRYGQMLMYAVNTGQSLD